MDPLAATVNLCKAGVPASQINCYSLMSMEFIYLSVYSDNVGGYVTVCTVKL